MELLPGKDGAFATSRKESDGSRLSRDYDDGRSRSSTPKSSLTQAIG